MNELAKSIEKKQNLKITQYKIDRNGIKNAKVSKPIKFTSKKLIAFGLGTIMVASIATFVNKDDNKKSEIPDPTIVSTAQIEEQQLEPTIVTTMQPEEQKLEAVSIKTAVSDYKTANFEVGNDSNIQHINDFMQTSEYDVIEKYSKYYGIDPHVMTAIALQESSLNHEACLPGEWNYNGFAIGMMQLEQSSDGAVYDGHTVTAYNYETGEYDQINYTLENVKNYETNIQIACMNFQNTLEKYHGNLYLAIQSHNYGTGMMDSILEKTSEAKDINIETMIEHPFDVDWTNHLENAHNNPLEYISGWDQKTFGTSDYIYSVINCCPNEEVKFIYDGKEICFNLQNGHMSEQNKIR